MYMQLEDEFGDVVGKARRGQEKAVVEVAAAAGLSAEDIERMERYELTPGPAEVRRLAHFLGLDEEKLLGSAEKTFFPLYPAGRSVEGFTVEMLILEVISECPTYGYGIVQLVTGRSGGYFWRRRIGGPLHATIAAGPQDHRRNVPSGGGPVWRAGHGGPDGAHRPLPVGGPDIGGLRG